jgi:hypothetical protein
MKTLSLLTALALSLCASMSAQESAVQTPTTYSFQDVNYPGDTFTQLLGINNSGVIAGYHNFNKNSGFTLVLPNHFTTENWPSNERQTQITGINNQGITVGFYMSSGNGRTYGFYRLPSGFVRVAYPGSIFNQLLGQNDHNQAAGYYSMSINNTTPDVPYIYDELGGVFQVLTIPEAVGGAQATGINNSQQVCGFYIDKNNVNHGFFLNFGTFKTLDFPGSIFTQALGLNNVNEVVGVYQDNTGASHGFVYNTSTKQWQSVDDPNGIGTTIVNGTNDKHELVGFWGTNPTNTGFVATPLP